ncbi:Bicoid-interacting protein 3-domain-containing protein [Hygrophoropsis aurantiaca]|uniref:Bicoid-interacting protein 3-domain-containing protein n=1 Tax=Hygrophoropsis aurantiaca TaxID=72124 RepID=A0ACB8AD07_9AGAM|nr:Bicoid-interacting protein 3-domain-containing protein [Hygrophoropsis aurantiaca]
MSRFAVPVHGNYHGYYSKRPSIRDPRLALLPADFFQAKRVLDVGCNEGWVTCEIAQTWGASQVIGVDIDDTLIRAAWKRRRTVWSLQAPSGIQSSEPSNDIDLSAISEPSQKRMRMSLPSEGNISDYFPASCEHIYGPLPIPNHVRDDHDFPHNVSFRAADWLHDEIPEDKTPYDIIIAFSISKWIHLNSGDEGLLRFFERVHNALKLGGTFILEPQAWDTYAKARRMDDSLKENARNLKIRPNEFEIILQKIGFGSVQHLGTTGEGGFHRPVDLYVKV